MASPTGSLCKFIGQGTVSFNMFSCGAGKLCELKALTAFLINFKFTWDIKLFQEETQQREIDALTKRGHRWLAHHKVKGFFNVVGAKDFEAGARSLMQSVGIGKLKPNMLLMGYKSEWKKCDQEDLLKYFNVIQ